MLVPTNDGFVAMNGLDIPTFPGAAFELTLVNLTAGQPLSPLVVIAHTDAFSLFKVGDVASVALESIA